MRTLGVATLALLLSGCGTDPAGPSAPLGSTFRLGVGESVSIQGSGIELGIDQVLDDSRCPADALCVWPGTARIQAWYRSSGSARRPIELLTFPKAPVPIDGYLVDVFALQPFPYSNVRIDPRGYVATLVVRHP